MIWNTFFIVLCWKIISIYRFLHKFGKPKFSQMQTPTLKPCWEPRLARAVLPALPALPALPWSGMEKPSATLGQKLKKGTERVDGLQIKRWSCCLICVFTWIRPKTSITSGDMFWGVQWCALLPKLAISEHVRLKSSESWCFMHAFYRFTPFLPAHTPSLGCAPFAPKICNAGDLPTPPCFPAIVAPPTAVEGRWAAEVGPGAALDS